MSTAQPPGHLRKEDVEAGIAYGRWLHMKEFTDWRNEKFRECGVPTVSAPVCFNHVGKQVYEQVLRFVKSRQATRGTVLLADAERKAVMQYLFTLKDGKRSHPASAQVTSIKRATLQMGTVTKFLSNGKRMISGVATSRTTDRVGDIVEPSGGRWTLPVPLLWAHSHKDPIGWVRAISLRADGLWIEAEIAQGFEKADEVWRMVEANLVDSFSIGFSAQDWVPISTGGKQFTSWTLHEVSVVVIPANPDAKIRRSQPSTGPVKLLQSPSRTVSLIPSQKSGAVKLIRRAR